MNLIIVTGRMTKDPSIRQTNSGKPVASFVIASDKPYRNADGKREADFLPVVVYGNKGVELVEKFGKHNATLMVQGRMQIRNFTTATGELHYVPEIIATRLEFANPYPAANAAESSLGLNSLLSDEAPF